MILAAGLGTRLRPITDTMPKALVPVRGRPLLSHVMNRLVATGVTRIIVNTCHHAAQVSAFLERNAPPGVEIALSPEPGVFDDTQPVVFPTNFPPEAFWYTADATIVDAASGIDLTYIAHLEAAFAAEEPKDGNQVSFARIRIRVDVPTPGTYTITHPYGVEVIEVTPEDFGTDGDRGINMTRDLGIGPAKNRRPRSGRPDASPTSACRCRS